MRMLGLLITILLGLCNIFANEVTVTGLSGGNTDSPLQLIRYSDPVAGREVLISSLTPDMNGRFTFVLENEGVTELFIRNGIHDNHFFIDGSNSIDLVLYPYREISGAEEQNPFFEHIKVYAASTNLNDLNNQILNFDNNYLDLNNKLVDIVLGGEEAEEPTRMIIALEESVAKGENGFLDDWVICRIASLKLTMLRNPDSRGQVVSNAEDSFDPLNRASVELVDGVFSQLLRELSVESGGSIVRSTISGESPITGLRDFAISVTGITNQQLVEYIILKNLYLEYYTNYFNREGIFNMIRWIGDNGAYEYLRAFAAEIGDRIGRFLPGAPIPDFTLKGPGGEEYSPANWRGKFLLISFGKSDSWSTISEFNLLKGWNEKYSDHIEIVTILCDKDYKESVAKMEMSGFNWLMLDGSLKGLPAELYEVKFFPTFFLADPEGKIIVAPAPMPSENLRQLFLQKLQPYLINNRP